MYNREKEYRAIISALGGSLLLFLLLFHTVYGGVVSVQNILIRQFASSDVVYIISELFCYCVYILIFVLPVMFFYGITKGVKNHPMDLTLKMPKHRPLFSYVAIIFSGLAVVIVMAYVNQRVVPVPPSVSFELFKGIDNIKAYVYALGFFGSAVVPAFSEELLFRGLIVSNIKPYSRKGAVVISALAFGLMHQNPIQVIYATAAGAVLALIYLKTESIWCCIALHFVNNFVSVAQSIAVSLFGEEEVRTILMWCDVATVAVGILFGVALLLISLKQKKQKSIWYAEHFNKEDKNISSGRFCLETLFNPTICIFVVLCIAVTVLKGMEIYNM